MDVTMQTLIGETTTYKFTNPGTYLITLNVTDAAGNFNIDTVTVKVNDVTPPMADAGSSQKAAVNTQVSFDASGSSDNVRIVNYEWDFGDGNTGTGITTTHTYTEAKTYTVTLTVKDAAGNTYTDTVTVNVEGGLPWTTIGIGVAFTAIVAIAIFFFLLKRRKKFECETCGLSFDSEEELREHNRKVHQK
jgi:PKD repeat protein